MKTKKFWNWTNQEQAETTPAQRILTLNGTIAEESWFDDDVTPQLFKEDLMAGTGDVTGSTAPAVTALPPHRSTPCSRSIRAR